MSADFYLMSLQGRSDLTKEDLNDKLPSEFSLSDCREDALGMVTDFTVSEDEVNVVFHKQEDGTWWHPVYGEDGEADLELVERVMHYLNWEFDLEKMG